MAFSVDLYSSIIQLVIRYGLCTKEKEPSTRVIDMVVWLSFQFILFICFLETRSNNACLSKASSTSESRVISKMNRDLLCILNSCVTSGWYNYVWRKIKKARKTRLICECFSLPLQCVRKTNLIYLDWSYSRFCWSENSPWRMQRKMLFCGRHLPIFTVVKHHKMCWYWWFI